MTPGVGKQGIKREKRDSELARVEYLASVWCIRSLGISRSQKDGLVQDLSLNQVKGSLSLKSEEEII